MVRQQSLVHVSQQISLRAAVKRQAGFIEQDYQVVAIVFPQLGEPHKEREKPDKTRTASLEWNGCAMPLVVDSGTEDPALIERGRVLGPCMPRWTPKTGN